MLTAPPPPHPSDTPATVLRRAANLLYRAGDRDRWDLGTKQAIANAATAVAQAGYPALAEDVAALAEGHGGDMGALEDRLRALSAAVEQGRKEAA